MSQDTDKPEELLAAWQQLDADLRAFFSRRVPADDVDDLLQDCFLKVSHGLPSLQDRERLGAWVFRTARNLVVDHLRRRSSSPTANSEREGTEHLVAEAPDADVSAQVGGWLPAMIDQLPAKYSQVLHQSELEERSQREIADRLGLSVSGVKSRVQRGRSMLRDKLLACCALEFDRRGGIQDYKRHAPRDCDC